MGRYGGWGAADAVFAPGPGGNDLRDRERLRAVLARLGGSAKAGERLFRSAGLTVLNAHYTDPMLVGAIYQTLATLGLDQGTVVEPGAGSGQFAAFAPGGIRITGVELDTATALIAQLLHPDAEILTGSVSDPRFARVRDQSAAPVRVPRDTADGFVGNVPFSDVKWPDEVLNPGTRFSLHDHAIRWGVTRVAPGGLCAFITSRYTADTVNPRFRRTLAGELDLIGMVRLPSTAHKRMAGTPVVTDIIIGRRIADGERPLTGPETWEQSRPLAIPGSSQPARVNTYFHHNPRHILGTLQAGGMYRAGDFTVAPSGDLEQQLGAALGEIAGRALAAGQRHEPRPAARPVIEILSRRPDGTIAAKPDGTFTQVVHGQDVPLVISSEREADQTRKLVALAEARSTLIRAEASCPEDTDEIDAMRSRMGELYDAYTAAYGPIGRFTTRTVTYHVKTLEGVLDRLDFSRKDVPDPEVMLLEAYLGRDALTRIVRSAADPGQTRHSTRKDKHGETVTVATQLVETAKVRAALMAALAQVPQGADAEALTATFSERMSRIETGEQRTRLMPAAFRSDPRRPAVEALETFDPVTQTATKKPVFSRRTAMPHRMELGADTPQEALDLVLIHRRRVDLGEIARLLGTDQADARAQLGTLVFHDPATGDLVAGGEYLSGNVLEKLAAARTAAAGDPERYTANVESLQAVQPPALAAEDIQARLGSAWLSREIVQEGLRYVLEDPRLTVIHPGGSEWKVDSRTARNSRAQDTYGTSDWNALGLAGALLTNASITVRRTTIDPVTGAEKSYRDDAATLFAFRKAQRLDADFVSWLWSDPDRADECVRLYNSAYNNQVKRVWDASPFYIPGLAPGMKLHPFQNAMVRRLHTESGMAAWVVGSGKTELGITAAMEGARLGRHRLTAIVTPASLVNQWRDRIYRTFPEARVLVADDDLRGRKDAREVFTECAASGDYQLAITPYEFFGSLPLSAGAARASVDEEIDKLTRYAQEATAQGDRYTAKELQGKIAKLEAKYSAAVKASGGAAGFTDAGIDSVVVDEWHNFRRIRRDSNNRLLAMPGSGRANHMLAVFDYLRKHHPEGLRLGLSGTPLEQSIADAWAAMRFFTPERLKELGLEEFDAFLTTFGRTEPRREPTPTGSGLHVRERQADWFNLPDMRRTLWDPFADVVRRADLGLNLPRLAGGRPQTHVLPQTLGQAHMQADIDSRYEMFKAGDRDGDNHILKLMDQAGKNALHPRMLGIETDGKIKLEVWADDAATWYHASKDTGFLDRDGNPHPVPGALRMVACELGVPDPAKPNAWSVYSEMRSLLAARGVPADAIRFAQDADSDRKKAALWEDARTGRCNFVIGSAQTAGTGVDVPDRLQVLDYMTLSWNPTQFEQWLGRIVRQGNQNPEVAAHVWATEGTIEVLRADKISMKSAPFEALLDGTSETRRLTEEDDNPISAWAAEMTARMSGNPLLTAQREAQLEVDTAQGMQNEWQRENGVKARRLAVMDKEIQELEAVNAAIDGALSRAVDTKGDKFAARVGTGQHTVRAEAGAALIAALTATAAGDVSTLTGGNPQHLAELAGFPVTARYNRVKVTIPAEAADGQEAGPDAEPADRTLITLGLEDVPQGQVGVIDAGDLPGRDPVALITSLEDRIRRLPGQKAKNTAAIAENRDQITKTRAELARPSPYLQQLANVRDALDRIEAQINEQIQDDTPAPDAAVSRASGRADGSGTDVTTDPPAASGPAGQGQEPAGTGTGPPPSGPETGQHSPGPAETAAVPADKAADGDHPSSPGGTEKPDAGQAPPGSGLTREDLDFAYQHAYEYALGTSRDPGPEQEERTLDYAAWYLATYRDEESMPDLPDHRHAWARFAEQGYPAREPARTASGQRDEDQPGTGATAEAAGPPGPADPEPPAGADALLAGPVSGTDTEESAAVPTAAAPEPDTDSPSGDPDAERRQPGSTAREPAPAALGAYYEARVAGHPRESVTWAATIEGRASAEAHARSHSARSDDLWEVRHVPGGPDAAPAVIARYRLGFLQLDDTTTLQPATGQAAAAESVPAAASRPPEGTQPLAGHARWAGNLRPERLLYPDGTLLTIRGQGEDNDQALPATAAGVIPARAGSDYGPGRLQVVRWDDGRYETVHPALASPRGTNPYDGLGDRDRARWQAFDYAEAWPTTTAGLLPHLVDPSDVVEVQRGPRSHTVDLREVRSVERGTGRYADGLEFKIRRSKTTLFYPGNRLVPVCIPDAHPTLAGAIRAALPARPGQPETASPAAGQAAADAPDTAASAAPAAGSPAVAPSPSEPDQPGRYSSRVRISLESGPPVVSGTSYDDPAELREALRANFTWRKKRQLWEYTGRSTGPLEAVAAIRDVLARLDRESKTLATSAAPAARQPSPAASKPPATSSQPQTFPEAATADETGTHSGHEETVGNGPAEPESSPLTNSDLAAELRRLPGFARWLSKAGTPPAGGTLDPQRPGSGSSAICDERGIEITVSGPGFIRHGLVTWPQAANWIDKGVTSARLGLVIIADRLSTFCRDYRDQLTAASICDPGATAAELGQIRDTAIAMIVDAALRSRGSAVLVPPARPDDPAWYTTVMTTRPDRGSGNAENAAMERLTQLRTLIREPQPATAADIRATLQRRIGYGLADMVRALDDPAAVRTWINGQASQPVPNGYDNSGERWYGTSPHGLITDRNGDDRAPVLIRWEEIPAWIQPGITSSLRDRLLDASDASSVVFRRFVGTAARQDPGAAPDEEEDKQVRQRLHEAADAAWAAIEAAPPPSSADLDRARRDYRDWPPVQQTLFDDLPQDSTLTPGDTRVTAFPQLRPAPAAPPAPADAARPAATAAAPTAEPPRQPGPPGHPATTRRPGPSPGPAPDAGTHHPDADSPEQRTIPEHDQQADPRPGTASPRAAGPPRQTPQTTAAAPAGPAHDDAPEPPQTPASNSDLAIALHSMSGQELTDFLARGKTPDHHGSLTNRRKGLPDGGAHQELNFDRAGVRITVRSRRFRRNGQISWRQVASWIDTGLTPARLGIITAASGLHIFTYVRRDELIGAGKDGIDAAIRELSQISTDAIDAVLSAALAARDADAPVPSARSGKPAYRGMAMLTGPDPSATPEENAVLARIAELGAAIRGTQPVTPADIRTAIRWWIGDSLPEYARALAGPEAMRAWIRRQASGHASRPGHGTYNSGRYYGAYPEGLRTGRGRDTRIAPWILWEDIPAWIQPGLSDSLRDRLAAAEPCPAPGRKRTAVARPPVGGADPAGQADDPLPGPLRAAIDAAWAAIEAAPSPSPADLDHARAVYRATSTAQQPLPGSPAKTGQPDRTVTPAPRPQAEPRPAPSPQPGIPAAHRQDELPAAAAVGTPAGPPPRPRAPAPAAASTGTRPRRAPEPAALPQPAVSPVPLTDDDIFLGISRLPAFVIGDLLRAIDTGQPLASVGRQLASYSGERAAGEPEPGARETVTAEPAGVRIQVTLADSRRTGLITWRQIDDLLDPGLTPDRRQIAVQAWQVRVGFMAASASFRAVGEGRLAAAAEDELRNQAAAAVAAILAAAHPATGSQAPQLADEAATVERISELAATLPSQPPRPRTHAGQVATGDIIGHPGYKFQPLRVAAPPRHTGTAIEITGTLTEPSSTEPAGQITLTLTLPRRGQAGPFVSVIPLPARSLRPLFPSPGAAAGTVRPGPAARPDRTGPAPAAEALADAIPAPDSETPASQPRVPQTRSPEEAMPPAADPVTSPQSPAPAESSATPQVPTPPAGAADQSGNGRDAPGSDASARPGEGASLLDELERVLDAISERRRAVAADGQARDEDFTDIRAAFTAVRDTFGLSAASRGPGGPGPAAPPPGPEQPDPARAPGTAAPRPPLAESAPPDDGFADIRATFADLRDILGLPARGRHARSDRPPNGADPSIADALDQAAAEAQACARWYRDTPEWQRISTVGRAARDLVTAIREAAGDYWAEIRLDIRVRGFARTLAARTALAVSGAAHILAARLEHAGYRDSRIWRVAWRLHQATATFASQVMRYTPAGSPDRMREARRIIDDLGQRQNRPGQPRPGRHAAPRSAGGTRTPNAAALASASFPVMVTRVNARQAAATPAARTAVPSPLQPVARRQ